LRAQRSEPVNKGLSHDYQLAWYDGHRRHHWR
jgi:hypothetical protein